MPRKRERRLEQHGGRDAESAPDEHGRHEMRQDVEEQDARAAGADRPLRLDELALGERARLV